MASCSAALVVFLCLVGVLTACAATNCQVPRNSGVLLMQTRLKSAGSVTPGENGTDMEPEVRQDHDPVANKSANLSDIDMGEPGLAAESAFSAGDAEFGTLDNASDDLAANMASETMGNSSGNASSNKHDAESESSDGINASFETQGEDKLPVHELAENDTEDRMLENGSGVTYASANSTGQHNSSGRVDHGILHFSGDGMEPNTSTTLGSDNESSGMIGNQTDGVDELNASNFSAVSPQRLPSLEASEEVADTDQSGGSAYRTGDNQSNRSDINVSNVVLNASSGNITRNEINASTTGKPRKLFDNSSSNTTLDDVSKVSTDGEELGNSVDQDNGTDGLKNASKPRGANGTIEPLGDGQQDENGTSEPLGERQQVSNGTRNTSATKGYATNDAHKNRSHEVVLSNATADEQRNDSTRNGTARNDSGSNISSEVGTPAVTAEAHPHIHAPNPNASFDAEADTVVRNAVETANESNIAKHQAEQNEAAAIAASKLAAGEVAAAQQALDEAKSSLEAAFQERVRAAIKAASDEANAKHAEAEAMIKKAVTATAAAENATVEAQLAYSAVPVKGADAIANVTRHSCVTDVLNTSWAWLIRSAEPGTPCLFGIDPRDEGSHCIDRGGPTGKNGWCYTASGFSFWQSWGPCADTCHWAQSIQNTSSNISSSPQEASSSMIDDLRQQLQSLMQSLKESMPTN